MLAAILAITLATVPTGTVTQCHIDKHGNAGQCTSYRVARLFDREGPIGLEGPLHGRTTQTWSSRNPRTWLYKPRVNGRRGHWNYDHTLMVWPRLHVTFDGISFANYSHRTVRIMSHTISAA